MSVDSVASAASTPPGIYDPGASSTAMGKDDFLTLLITQLQNQDPLNPADSTEYTAQLAQFSSLEQLSNVNANLEYMQLYQASINNAQAVSFIGKEIIALGDEVQVTDGQAENCRFELSGDASGVVVNIYDGNGKLVKAIEQGAMNAGRQTVAWDGTDQNGNTVDDGNYTFEIQAVDGADQDVAAVTYSSGLVEGVTFIEGRTYFLVGNQKIPISDIVEVIQPETSDT